MTMREFDDAFVTEVTDLFEYTMGRAKRTDRADVRHFIGLYSCVSNSMEKNEDGSVSFIDLAGHKITAYRSGRVTVWYDGEIRLDKDGIQAFKREQLGKDNGYIYIPVFVTPDDRDHMWMAGAHTVIKMCFDIDDFEILGEEYGYTNICVNHLNNRGWDNRCGEDDNNLEWATLKENRAHGAMISVLFGSEYSWQYCEMVQTYDKSGLNRRKNHIVLKENLRLSVKDIGVVAKNIASVIRKV